MPVSTTGNGRIDSAASPPNAGFRNTPKELLKLAKRYDTRADRLSRRVSDSRFNLAVISPVLRGSPDLAHGLEEPAIAHDGLGQEDPDGREERCAASGTKSRRKGDFLGSGTGQKCVSSPVADDVESLPPTGVKRRRRRRPSRRAAATDSTPISGRPPNRPACSDPGPALTVSWAPPDETGGRRDVVLHPVGVATRSRHQHKAFAGEPTS
jgi:hypothetical protein